MMIAAMQEMTREIMSAPSKAASTQLTCARMKQFRPSQLRALEKTERNSAGTFISHMP